MESSGIDEKSRASSYFRLPGPPAAYFEYFYVEESGDLVQFWIPELFSAQKHAMTKINGVWCLPASDYWTTLLTVIYSKHKERERALLDAKTRTKSQRIIYSAGTRRFNRLKADNPSLLKSLPMVMESGISGVYKIEGRPGYWGFVQKEGIEALFLLSSDKVPRVMRFKRIENIDLSTVKISDSAGRG